MADGLGNVFNWAAFILAALILGAGLAFALAMFDAKNKWFAIVTSAVAASLVWPARAYRYVLGLVIAPQGVDPSTFKTQQLNQKQFNDHTNKVINAALSDGVVPNDVICATARALGVLVAFTARREHVDFNELLAFAQQATVEYSKDAVGFMQDNRGLWDRYG
jgi:hypothetical protein